MKFTSIVFLAFQLVMAREHTPAKINEYSYRLRPLMGEKYFGPVASDFRGDDVQIWKLTTEPNAAVKLQCDINIPETVGCTSSSLTFFVNGMGKTFCGRTTAYANYLGNSIVVLYRKQNPVYQPTTDPFRCRADSKIMSKVGPVLYRPPPINKHLPPIDDRTFGISPGRVETNCPCGWANRQIRNINAGRLVGGEDYEMNEYPFVVQLFNISTKHPYCAGTIITPSYVLTAGHCAIDYLRTPQRLGIGAGSHDNSARSPSSLQLNTARRIIIHEEFRVAELGLLHDIAILELTTPFRITMAVGPACIPGPQRDLTGQRVRILGWGAKAFRSLMTPRPQQVDMIVVDNLSCSYEWGSVSFINPSHLCTQAENKSTCQGDSGGPVVWLDPETNRYTLVGIVSYGPDCGDRKASVQTDVSAHLHWIFRWVKPKLGLEQMDPRDPSDLSSDRCHIHWTNPPDARLRQYNSDTYGAWWSS